MRCVKVLPQQQQPGKEKPENLTHRTLPYSDNWEQSIHSGCSFVCQKRSDYNMYFRPCDMTSQPCKSVALHVCLYVTVLLCSFERCVDRAREEGGGRNREMERVTERERERERER